MHKKHQIILILITLLLHDTIKSQETKNTFSKETNICIKAGTIINGYNKQLYFNLNEGLLAPKYFPDNVNSYHVNPCVSVGVEYHFIKHLALEFNLGFYQTKQNYKVPSHFLVTNINEEISVQYLNNNVFIELMPAYVYKHTRILGGFNVSLYYPSVLKTYSETNVLTEQTSSYTEKSKPDGSYHIYSTVGVMQGFKTKTGEVLLSVNYFGLLKKYDSGFNITLGYLF